MSETQINFRDEIMSLSRAADIVLREMGYDWKGAQGTICGVEMVKRFMI